MPRKKKAKSRRKPVTLAALREIALAFPGVEEGTSFGTLAFRVRKQFLARLREDGESLVVKVGFDEREMLMASDPETFFVTDHYLNYPSVLVRLTTVDREDLRQVIEQAWRKNASKRQVAAYEAGG